MTERTVVIERFTRRTYVAPREFRTERYVGLQRRICLDWSGQDQLLVGFEGCLRSCFGQWKGPLCLEWYVTGGDGGGRSKDL